MKRNILIALFFTGVLMACSDSDDGSDIPDNPGYPVTHFSKIELSEDREGDGSPVTTIEAYAYNAGRLTSFTYTQRFVAGESVEMQNATQVVYEDHKVVVTDDFGYTATYTLDDNGYAESCVYQEVESTRSYTFAYLITAEGKHYLKEVKETLNNEQFPYSTLTIEYSNDRITHITQLVSTYEQNYTIISSAEDEAANTSELPFRFLAELYPLTFHTAAIYGKLLGDSYETLIAQLKPDDDSESHETITYNFEFDARGIVTSCKEVTNSYDRNYIRSVSYAIK